MKLIIENFQSIEYIVIEIPEKSFTCIVGPSNIGKSAIRRAIECLLYNKSEASYIRNGKLSCKVTAVFDDGMTVEWSRTQKSSSYKINGEPYTKLGKTVPEPIIDKGFQELAVGKDKYSVQVASQFSNIFLLNQTGGKVTDVLSNLGNLNRLIKSNKLCLTDLKASKSKLSVRREDLKYAKAKVSSYYGLDTQVDILDFLKESFKNIKNLKQKHLKLFDLDSRLGQTVSAFKRSSPARKVKIVPFDIDVYLLLNLGKLLRKHSVLLDSFKEYSKISSLPEIVLDFDIEKISSLQKNLKTLTSAENIHNLYQKISLTKESDFSLEFDLDSYSKLSNLENNYDKLITLVKVYAGIGSIPSIGDIDLKDYSRLLDLNKRLEEGKSLLVSARTSFNEAGLKLSNLKKEDVSLRKELKVCPLCERDL